jgi:hypothetical protein
MSVRLSIRPSIPASLYFYLLLQVQINCQNQDWMHGLEIRDDLNFRRKKKKKTNLTCPTEQVGSHPLT